MIRDHGAHRFHIRFAPPKADEGTHPVTKFVALLSSDAKPLLLTSNGISVNPPFADGSMPLVAHLS